MTAEVERLGGLWTPISWRSDGLRKYGVPPGGPWNPNSEAIFRALGEPVLLGEAASPGPGPVVRLTSDSSCTWLILGSKGSLARGKEEAPIPALLVGQEPADLISESGGRWTVAVYPTVAAPLLRSLQTSSPVLHEEIRIIALPEYIPQLVSSEWMVSPQSSRIGLRLIGPAPQLPALAASRPSAPGVIQAPGKGELLIHGPAGPTSGGYQALGAVIRADLHRLAELPPGSNVRLKPVSREEALEIWRESRQAQNHIAAALAKLKRLGVV